MLDGPVVQDITGQLATVVGGNFFKFALKEGERLVGGPVSAGQRSANDALKQSLKDARWKRHEQPNWAQVNAGGQKWWVQE